MISDWLCGSLNSTYTSNCLMHGTTNFLVGILVGIGITIGVLCIAYFIQRGKK